MNQNQKIILQMPEMIKILLTDSKASNEPADA